MDQDTGNYDDAIPCESLRYESEYRSSPEAPPVPRLKVRIGGENYYLTGKPAVEMYAILRDKYDPATGTFPGIRIAKRPPGPNAPSASEILGLTSG